MRKSRRRPAPGHGRDRRHRRRAALGRCLAAGLAALIAGAGARAPSGPAPRPVAPADLIIGVDVSVGAPILSDKAFARAAAQDIAAMAAGLGYGSRVRLRVFGAEGETGDVVAFDLMVSPRMFPEEAAQRIEAVVSAAPRLVEAGTIRPAPDGSIVGFLNGASALAACADKPARVVLVTDGVERSQTARMTEGEPLPPPDGVMFARCGALTMVGLGRGVPDDRLQRRLGREWRLWAEAAGFAAFECAAQR